MVKNRRGKPHPYILGSYPKVLLPAIIEKQLAKQLSPTIAKASELPAIPRPLSINTKQSTELEFYFNLSLVFLLAGLLFLLQLPLVWIICWVMAGSLCVLCWDWLSKYLAQQSKDKRRSPKSSQYSHQHLTGSSEKSQKSLVPDNWQEVLAGEIVISKTVSSAPQGASEAAFLAHLQEHFGSAADWGKAYDIPESNLAYSSDLELFMDGLAIQIEIDEPYHGKNQEPHHCVDLGKDAQRDRFFLDYNWIIIRFSEFQVARYPLGCCGLIAKVLMNLTNNRRWQDLSERMGDLPIDPCWNTEKAQEMAQRNYRQSYLRAAAGKQV
jgi:hypothetical protein